MHAHMHAHTNAHTHTHTRSLAHRNAPAHTHMQTAVAVGGWLQVLGIAVPSAVSVIIAGICDI